jgi:hypothetical protein
MLQEVLYFNPEQRLRRLFFSFCIQNLNRAAPLTFRMHGEQCLKKIRKIKQPMRKRRRESEIFSDANRVI